MIYGNINEINKYTHVNESIKKCVEYLKNNDVQNYEKGKHEIDGDNFFVNIVEYETTTEDKRFWEAHRDYLDIHVMLNGQERIDLNFLSNMELIEYKKEDDFQSMKGNKITSVILNQDDFLVCYTGDAHMTALKVNESVHVKKAIFKIKF